tara:strand:- start:611 stop:1504 length:894 start_codon:yes stop_codon:yes gene_type:complete
MISTNEVKDMNAYLNDNTTELVKTNDFYIPVAILVVLCGLIYNSAFENNKYTCDNIVANVYLYVLVSLVLFHIFTLIFVKNKSIKYLYAIQKKMGNIVFLLLFVAILFGLFMVFYSIQTNIIGSHIMLVILIGIISYLLSYLFILLKMQGLYNQVILTTALLVFGIMCIFYYKQELIVPYLKDEKIYLTVVVIFIILIICKLIYFYIYGYSKMIRIVGASVVVVLFIYLLLADTQQILEITPSECKTALVECQKSMFNSKCNIEKYPSYPQKSYEIFNDIIVIAKNISEIFLASNND